MTDATQVTGSALAGQGPRAGDVLAERYELVELIDTDGPLLGFRAQDQETERTVLLRILSGPGIHTDTCDKIVERLRGLVGVGGRYLSSLVDADREKRWPFSIEAWPPGTPLSRVLDARRARGPLGPAEALPVIARLAAALDALPDEWHHGDVRAERVWLDADGLRLTGAFLLASLPDDERGERIGGLGPGTIAYPPEFRMGRSGRASDRWGVAAIGWEALYGRPYEPSAAAAPADRLQRALAALLGEEARRPNDLEELLDALAEAARLPRPQLDAEPHRPPTARFSWTGPHARLTPRAVEGAATGGTQEIELEQIEEDRSFDSLDPRLVRAALSDEPAVQTLISPDDTSRHRPIEGDLDPRLVRAALTVDLDRVLDTDEAAEPRRDSGPDSLDPRLVRAALGITLDSESDVVDLPSDELEMVETTGAKASPIPANQLASVPPVADPAARSAPVVRKIADRPPSAAARSAARSPSPAPRAPAPTPAQPLTRAPTPANPPSPRAQVPGPATAGQAAAAGPSPSARAVAPGSASRPSLGGGSAPAPAKSSARPPSARAATPAATPSRPPSAAVPAPGRPPTAAPAPNRPPTAAAPTPSRPPVAAAPAPSRPPIAAAPAPTPSRPPIAAVPAPTPSSRPAAPPAPTPEPAPARPRPAERAEAPAPTAPLAARPAPARPPRAVSEPTPREVPDTSGRSSAPAPRATRALTGILIVVAAVFLAVGIIGIGFLIAAGRRDAAQQRQLGPGVVVAPGATD